MDWARRIGNLLMVFLAGNMVSMNLTVMRYGIPNHYEANWGKVIFAILLALLFGLFAILEDNESQIQ